MNESRIESGVWCKVLTPAKRVAVLVGASPVYMQFECSSTLCMS